jgi:hypothetical protein
MSQDEKVSTTINVVIKCLWVISLFLFLVDSSKYGSKVTIKALESLVDLLEEVQLLQSLCDKVTQ